MSYPYRLIGINLSFVRLNPTNLRFASHRTCAPFAAPLSAREVLHLLHKRSKIRQLSTFPGGRPPSIIDVKELNFRVRHGNGWILLAIATGYSALALLL